ncbi:uncharacterized protein LOC113229045 [Hyposmocoma kahamanoa]|uniref:uncharacterized protein LOC113229045 n=1 Tax=Hyposmocoma kahamanoa TaxID=1477025 RepID=UPI000E6DA44F|nr:uncharacterized protein LOC113229045 [Hyposmocoma kahamanoa]
MPTIATFVFFDIETTGLPWQEKNQTKITDFSFVAASRKILEATSYGQTPLVSKFTVVLNPERAIHPKVRTLTGLSNELLQHAPVFKRIVKSLIMFLEDLTRPVCLVAHNGNVFDFKILLAECHDAGVSLPEDLLCVDSLVGFRALLKNSSLTYKDFEDIQEISLESGKRSEETISDQDILTDDEDEWSDLNLTNEELDEIDDICSSVSEFEEPACKPVNTQRSKAIGNVFDKKTATNDFKLTSLYKRLLNKEEINAHRAEVDCLILAECVVAMKHDFLPWADDNCTMLTKIKPLVRY